jgi:hypothetical protein
MFAASATLSLQNSFETLHHIGSAFRLDAGSIFRAARVQSGGTGRDAKIEG